MKRWKERFTHVSRSVFYKRWKTDETTISCDQLSEAATHPSALRTSSLKRQTAPHCGALLWIGSPWTVGPLSSCPQWSQHASAHHQCRFSLSLSRLAHHACAQRGRHPSGLSLPVAGERVWSGLRAEDTVGVCYLARAWS